VIVDKIAAKNVWIFERVLVEMGKLLEGTLAFKDEAATKMNSYIRKI
jgi:hypothetical protein